MAPAASAKLTPKQAAFVREYLTDLNATQAAIRAGYSAKTANREGTRLLSNAVIQSAIANGQVKRSERVEITADMVLQRWWLIASADPRELVELRRVECASCWPDKVGFRRIPNRECKSCLGEGIEAVFVRDQRTLSPGALALLAGVKQTKDGVEVKMHDQLAASQMVARHLGMFIDNVHTRNLTLEDALRERHAKRMAELDAVQRQSASDDE